MGDLNLVESYASQSSAYADAFAVFLAHTDQKVKARAWLDRLVQCLPQRRVFIDAGAGNGAVTGWFTDAFERTIAIEPSESLRRQLLQRCPAVEALGDFILTAKPAAPGDLILCSHVFYHIDTAQWLDHVQHMASWLAPAGTLVVALQNHSADGMRMLEHFHGQRFDLSALARRFEAIHGDHYRVQLETVPASVVTQDIATACTIAEFFLNDLPMRKPIRRADVEAYVRAHFSAPGGSFRFSCDQDFLQVRQRH